MWSEGNIESSFKAQDVAGVGRRKVWGSAVTLWRTADFTLLVGLNIQHDKERRGIKRRIRRKKEEEVEEEEEGGGREEEEEEEEEELDGRGRIKAERTKAFSLCLYLYGRSLQSRLVYVF